jgi:hypothetical protein
LAGWRGKLRGKKEPLPVETCLEQVCLFPLVLFILVSYAGRG